MLRCNQVSRTTVLVKKLSVLAPLGCALFGQEGGTIRFDPRETGELTWQTGLIGLLFALACCGLWKLVTWLLETKRAKINWAKLRIWWPTAMLLWAWVMLALSARNDSWGTEVLLLVFGLLNFPALAAVAMLLALLNGAAHPAVWLNILVGSFTMWSGNYILVRLAEWRAWINAAISLHLADPNPRR
jgi:hypothetical protein